VNQTEEPTADSPLRLTGFTASRSSATSDGNLIVYQGYSARGGIDEIRIGSSYAQVASALTQSAPPVVSLTAPAQDAVFTTPASVPITASVTANGRNISKVQFLSAGSLIGEDTSAPYSFTWNAAPIGSSRISARVIYDTGLVVSSGERSILVLNNGPVSFAVDVAASRRPISPLIYGVNNISNAAQLDELNYAINRRGGEVESRYDYKSNSYNIAKNWYFTSSSGGGEPAADVGRFIEPTLSTGADMMVTIPTIGWMPRPNTHAFSQAKYGLQTANEPYGKPDAGNGVLVLDAAGNPIPYNSTTAAADRAANAGNPTAKLSPFHPDPRYRTDRNDANYLPSDPVAYQAGFVNTLINRWGTAANGGIRYYTLGNEPGLWDYIHRDLHGDNAPSKEEVRDAMVAYGAMVKDRDAGAQVLGPSEWGWLSWKNYYPWLLSEMQANHTATGRRVLDMLTLHYYAAVDGPEGSMEKLLNLNRSTRSLWDPTWVDKSWINSVINLIPTMRSWVDQNYPGTKIGITEYAWGYDNTIAGAVIQAEVLGIFGREGLDLATRWGSSANNPENYIFKAMKMYRNYDGNKSTFGDVRVSTSTAANPDEINAFASQRNSDKALTIMVVNKQPVGTRQVSFSLANFTHAGVAEVYRLDSGNKINRLSNLAVSGTTLTTTFPPQSVTLLVLPNGGDVMLVADDGFGSSSFDSALNWSSGQAPQASRDYLTGAYRLRTPAGATGTRTFAGKSLTVGAGGSMLTKGANGSTIHIPSLTLDGGTIQNGDSDVTTYLTGNLAVSADSMLDADRATRQLIISSAISGVKRLTVASSVAPGGVVRLVNDNGGFSGAWAIQSGAALYIGQAGSSGGFGSGNMVNNGELRFQRSGSLSVSGNISGTGSLTSEENLALTLGGNNSYSGATSILNGDLIVTGSLGNTAVTIASPARLRGTGALAGNTTVNGTLAPGVNGIGTLSFGGNLTLAGTTTLELNTSHSVGHDAVTVGGSLQAGGALVVSNVGPALTAGKTFQLFNKGHGGSFNSISLPALPGGLLWQNRLSTDGSLAVVSSGPTITRHEAEGATLSGGVVAVSGSNAGYSGSGFADFPGGQGSDIAVTWTLNMSEASWVHLDVRYANGGSAARPLHLVVNGGSPLPLEFVSTTAWTDYRMQPAPQAVYLSAGSNTIVLRATNGSQGANIDRLDVTHLQSLEAEDAEFFGNILARNWHPGYTGSGYADYEATGSDVFIRWTINLPEPMTLPLNFRYANGGTTDRPLNLVIDGAAPQALAFGSTGGWGNYGIQGSPVVTLAAGSHTIDLVCDAGSAGGNIDSLLLPGGISLVPSPVPAGAARSSMMPDAKMDGGLDAYLGAHFTAAELANPDISGPGEDPDGDGFPNLLEYAMGGSDPASASSFFPPQVRPPVDATSGGTISFLRLVGGAMTASGYQAGGLLYQPVGSTDLQSQLWGLELVVVPNPQDLPNAPDGYEWMTYATPADIKQAFFRVGVSQETTE
jgi:autotransporter-associated beta strand protein